MDFSVNSRSITDGESDTQNAQYNSIDPKTQPKKHFKKKKSKFVCTRANLLGNMNGRFTPIESPFIIPRTQIKMSKLYLPGPCAAKSV